MATPTLFALICFYCRSWKSSNGHFSSHFRPGRSHMAQFQPMRCEWKSEPHPFPFLPSCLECRLSEWYGLQQACENQAVKVKRIRDADGNTVRCWTNASSWQLLRPWKVLEKAMRQQGQEQRFSAIITWRDSVNTDAWILTLEMPI